MIGSLSPPSGAVYSTSTSPVTTGSIPSPLSATGRAGIGGGPMYVEEERPTYESMLHAEVYRICSNGEMYLKLGSSWFTMVGQPILQPAYKSKKLTCTLSELLGTMEKKSMEAD